MNDAELVRSLDLHDSNLFSIESMDHVVVLGFKTSSGLIKLSISDVQGLLVEDFLSGNIIFDFNVYPVDAIPVDELRVMNKMVDQYISIYGSLTGKAREMSSIVLARSSYGAAIVLRYNGKIETL